MAKSEKTHKPGTFMRLRLKDGSFGYARLLKIPFAAFYQYRTMSPALDLDSISSSPVAFTVAIHRSVVQASKVIGWRELEGVLTKPVVQFIQDVGDFRQCTILDSAGNERVATPQECLGLERAAVWEDRHVKRRLLDTLEGRINEEYERLRVRLQ